jgi:hypothetical protein
MNIIKAAGNMQTKRWTILAAAAASLFIGQSDAFAQRRLSPVQENRLALAAIVARLAPGTTLADSAAVVDAVKDAIADNPPAIDARIKVSSLVGQALIYAPRFAPEIAKAGLDDISTVNPANAVTEASVITRLAMNAALTGKPSGSPRAGNPTTFNGTAEKSDGAAAVTATAVASVVDSANVNLLDTVVRTAVLTAARYGLGDTQNGAGGAVVGAISQVAGNSNGDINDNAESTTGPGAIPTSNDELVRRVIRVAAASAPSRVQEIAVSVGYAFAATYRATTADITEISFDIFKTNNLTELEDEIRAGLQARLNQLGRPRTPAARRERATILAALADANFIRDQVESGIARAYTGAAGPGDEGVGFDNGNTDPVTDVQGV